MEKQNVIEGIRLIAIIGVFVFIVIGSYKNITIQGKLANNDTSIKNNEMVKSDNSDLEKKEELLDIENETYEKIIKEDMDERHEMIVNDVQSENAYTDLINEAYVITNNYRSLAGVSPLTLDSSLVEAASIRAKELSNSFSHTRPSGSSCFTVLSEYGISYGTAGENIAAGYSSSQSVMEGWRSSSGHYQNIISSKFKKIGIGVNIVNNQYYWVQIFSD